MEKNEDIPKPDWIHTPLGTSFVESGLDVTIEMTTEYNLSKIRECVKAGNYLGVNQYLKYLAFLMFYANIAAERGARIPYG